VKVIGIPETSIGYRDSKKSEESKSKRRKRQSVIHEIDVDKLEDDDFN
jgi:hypothetical protein